MCDGTGGYSDVPGERNRPTGVGFGLVPAGRVAVRTLRQEPRRRAPVGVGAAPDPRGRRSTPAPPGRQERGGQAAGR